MSAWGINNLGQIVGTDAGAAYDTFLYAAGAYSFLTRPGASETDGFVPTADGSRTIDDPDAVYGTQVLGVSTEGQLVGFELEASAPFSFGATPATVPEPGPLALVGIGPGGLGAAAGRGARRRA